MSKSRVQVLSPDGITIENVWSYPSKEKAESAFKKWRKRYEKQGYYSSNEGRIPLDELKSHCKFVKLPN